MNPTEPPLLLESVRLENGQTPLLAHHQERVDRSRQRFYPRATGLRLARVLRECDLPQTGIHKIRLIYGESIERILVEEYQPRLVRSLRLVDATGLNYGHKYANRAGIDKLFAQRNSADDVLLVQNGYICDTSYANVACYDGQHWYTPAWPLLRGVRRSQLLQEGHLRLSMIRVRDLDSFTHIRLFNAMLEWEEGPVIPLGNVIKE